MYAISKCAFLRLSFGNSVLKTCFFIKKSNNVGVERGVATRRAQMVWPMMIVTVTNFKGSNFEEICSFSSEIHFSVS